MHKVSFTLSKNSSQTVNRYANVVDVAGNAGISGVSTDPFDWGVPDLSFSSLSSAARPRSRRSAPTGASRRPTRGRGRSGRTRCGSAATSGWDASQQPDRPERARRVRLHRACTPRAAQRPRAATASTSPTSCSACRSRPACSTARATSTLRGRSMSLFVQDDWRKSVDADLQPGASLRAAVAVHREGRPDGEPRRGAGFHRRRRRSSPAEPGRTPARSRRR